MPYLGGMDNRSGKKPKRPRDLNLLAQAIVKAATEGEPEVRPEDEGKNPHAVALGRLGGLKGGKARAAKLTKKQLSEIGKKAARARWRNDNL